ncbi:reactive intermediate/imine deaminase [Erysipelotrichaceae bacterium MTC7]|nr:reactive intermediate/imine deaminase [Erysipelotrichaceae bacterium MTC7]
MQFLQKIESSNAPAPVGAYSPAVKLGDFMYMSGQLGLDPKTNELVEGGVAAQTKQAMENIRALLNEVGLDMHHIVKTTILLADINDFSAVNDVYGDYFTDVFPARSAFQVAALPKGAAVEIECMVIDTLVYERQAEQQHNHDGCDSCGDGCGCGGC